jgi:hypothetical protein
MPGFNTTLDFLHSQPIFDKSLRMRIILLAIYLLPLFGIAQMQKPTYPEVVRTFFKNYTYENSMDPVEGISFGKKKQGWTVMVIDRMNENVKAEYLFWPAKDNKFLPLKFAEGTEDHIEKADTYLSDHSFDLFSYDRNIYYGYKGWQDDVIAEFGNGDLISYPDTLIECLGRAFASTADLFMPYQNSNPRAIENENFKPGLLEQTSRKRVDSINYYIRKAIGSFKVLYDKNPRYETLVGNSGSKWFIEIMHGYQQMMMAGYPEIAKEYIQMIRPEESIRMQAKNYLSACSPNSILFTYGDNDTYPLWWIQAAEDYRTDVTVINNSLLGLPVYIHTLKKNNAVEFSSTAKIYSDRSFLYWPYAEEGMASITLPELLSYVQQKKKLHNSDLRLGDTYSIPAKTFTLLVDTARLKKQNGTAHYGTVVNFQLNNEGYLLNNEFMILDIINSNFSNHPIYFTAAESMFGDYLLNKGFIFHLLPLDQSKKALNENISMKNKLDFVKEKFSITPSNDFSKGITFSGFENQAYPLYASLASWYTKNRKPNEARMLINELISASKNNLVFSFNEKELWLALLEAGDLSAISHLEAYAKKVESLYLNPQPLFGYITKPYASYYLDELIEKLKAMKITNQKIEAIRARL